MIGNPATLNNMTYIGHGSNGTSQFKDGWFYPGDLGYVRDGHLFVTGRMSEIINAGGNKISLSHIANLLKEKGLVNDACAISIRNADGVEDIAVAYVNATPVDATAMTAAVQSSDSNLRVTQVLRVKSLPHYSLDNECHQFNCIALTVLISFYSSSIWMNSINRPILFRNPSLQK